MSSGSVSVSQKIWIFSTWKKSRKSRYISCVQMVSIKAGTTHLHQIWNACCNFQFKHHRLPSKLSNSPDQARFSYFRVGTERSSQLRLKRGILSLLRRRSQACHAFLRTGRNAWRVLRPSVWEARRIFFASVKQSLMFMWSNWKFWFDETCAEIYLCLHNFSELWKLFSWWVLMRKCLGAISGNSFISLV